MFNRIKNNTVSNLRTGYGPVQKKNSTGYQMLTVALALLYGGLLANLPMDAMLDRENYLTYAKISWTFFEYYWSISPLNLFSNEPLWLLLNDWLAKVLSPETVVRLFIFVPASLVAWNVLRQDPRQFIWLLLFLLLQPVIKNHIVHLRQGVAIAIFLTGWFSSVRIFRWLLLSMTPFIHSSFFLVLALLAVANVARRLKLGTNLRTLLFVIAGLVTGTILGWVASLLGARQADQYFFTMTNVSGLGFAFWGVVVVLMCMQGRTFVRRHVFELGTIIFYLATYFLLEVTARIFENTLLLVLLAGLHLTGWRRRAFFYLIVCFGILQYALKLNSPWLGFGVL